MNTRWNKAIWGAALIVGLTMPPLIARAEDGCGVASSPSSHASHSIVATLKEPLSSVLDNYLKIGAALAKDSLDGVPAAAMAIRSQTLPSAVITAAETLARAKDLAVARAAFKALSAALIQQLEEVKAQTGRYHEVYCGMAQASWLQESKTVANPYYGRSMARCGEIKRTF